MNHMIQIPVAEWQAW